MARLRKYILAVPILVTLFPLVGIVLFLIGQWEWGLVMVLIGIFINIWSETLPIHHLGVQWKTPGSLRLMTYNVNRAHSISVNKGTTQGFIRFILRQDADIILLQEYNHLLYPEIGERLANVYPYGLEAESKNDRFKSVFSRYPIDEYEQLWVNADDARYGLLQHAWYCKSRDGHKEVLPVCSMVVNVDNRRIRIINCHLMSNNFSVVIRNSRKKGQSLLRAIPPIMARMDFGYSARKLQAEIVAEHIARNSEEGIIVCGDLNDIGGSTTIRVFRHQGLKDAWWQKGWGYGFTFHGMKLRLRLDHVLFSKSLIPQNIFVPHSISSDHDPIVCDFSFR